MELIEDFPSDCVTVRDILRDYLETNEWPFIRGRLLLEDYVYEILEERGLLTDPKTRKPKIQQQRIRLCITRAMKQLEYRLSSNSTNAYINCRIIHAEEKDRERKTGEKEEISSIASAPETSEIEKGA